MSIQNVAGSRRKRGVRKRGGAFAEVEAGVVGSGEEFGMTGSIHRET